MKTVLLLLTICLGVSDLAWAQESSQESKGISITGKVVALDENDKGEVISVEIATEDGKYYTVNNDAKGLELCKHVGKTVKLSGHLKTISDGSEVLFVESFDPAPEPKMDEAPSK